MEFLFARYGKLYEPGQAMVARCTVHLPLDEKAKKHIFDPKDGISTYFVVAHFCKEFRFSQSSRLMYSVLSGVGVVTVRKQ